MKTKFKFTHELLQGVIMAAFVIFMLIVTSCSKEDTKPTTTCKTCDVNVKYKHTDRASGSTQVENYVESSKEYCDDTWKTVDGESHTYSGSTSQYSYYQYVKTTACH